jgi:hypothetical protein
MSIVATLGIVGGLVVLALMAVAPVLVSLNERFPVEERGPRPADRTRQSLLSRHPSLLRRHTATH